MSTAGQTEPDNFIQRLRSSRNGDQQALVSLLEEISPKLRRDLEISAQWQSVLDKNDVLQVTFMETFLRFHQFAGQTPRSFEAWIRQINRNNLLSAVRGLSREKRNPSGRRVIHWGDQADDWPKQFGTVSSTPSRTIRRRERAVSLKQAMERLPSDYAHAIQAFEMDGCSGEEAALRLKRSRGAAFMLLARARDRLREILGSESDFFSK